VFIDLIEDYNEYAMPIDLSQNIKLSDTKYYDKSKKNILLVYDNIELLSYFIDTMKDKYILCNK
jgi:hypothetical protein